MSVQFRPSASQRNHWRPKVIGSVPLHVPCPAVSVWPIRGSPVTVGGSWSSGAVPPTTVVAPDTAGVELPWPFVAVTATRIRLPTSAAASTYVAPVALPMSTQFAPAASQRRHWRAKVIGAVPFHAPSDAVSGWPSAGVPEISGSAVFDGALAPITALAADSASADPAELVAVTRTRRRLPTSAVPGEYEAPVALGMFTQFAPAASQRRHWRVIVSGTPPDHEPSVTVSVPVSVAVPATAGSAVFEGGVLGEIRASTSTS